MPKIKIQKIKSTIGKNFLQKRTMEALGLRKMNQIKEYELNSALQGMINKIRHLIKIENI